MRSFSFILSLLFLTSVSAQEIQMSEDGFFGANLRRSAGGRGIAADE